MNASRQLVQSPIMESPRCFVVVWLLMWCLLTAGPISNLHGKDIQAVGSKTVIGEDATFQCRLNPNISKAYDSLKIRDASTKVNQYVYHQLRMDWLLQEPSSMNARYKYNKSSYTMTVEKVECSDEKTLECYVLDSETGQSETSSDQIIVKVPPSDLQPMMTVPILFNGIMEGTRVNFTCNANTGRPGQGRITWDFEQTISETEILERVPIESEDKQCTERHATTLTATVVRETFPVVTCSVVSDDFPSNDSTPPMTSCEVNVAGRLCRSTGIINVLYTPSIKTLTAGINSVTSRQFWTELGETLTLVCEARGNPTPSLTLTARSISPKEDVPWNVTMWSPRSHTTRLEWSTNIMSTFCELGFGLNYTCQAENEIGIVSEEQFVLVECDLHHNTTTEVTTTIPPEGMTTEPTTIDTNITDIRHCPYRQGFLYPHPDRCHKYMTCQAGVYEAHTCRDGLVFSEIVGACVRFNSLLDTCTRNNPSQYCADHPKKMVKIPHPTSCRHHYTCEPDGRQGTTYTLHVCSNQNLFDVLETRCKPEDEAFCGFYRHP